MHKDQSKASNALCVVSHIDTVNTRYQSTQYFNGSNSVYVDTIDTLVSDAFMKHYILFIHGQLPLQKGRLLLAFHPVGLAVCQSEEAASLPESCQIG